MAKCRNCGEEIDIPNRVFRNLETYNQNGSALTYSDCCGIGYIVKSTIKFTVTEYTGNKEEDDWGVKLKKNNLK